MASENDIVEHLIRTRRLPWERVAGAEVELPATVVPATVQLRRGLVEIPSIKIALYPKRNVVLCVLGSTVPFIQPPVFFSGEATTHPKRVAGFLPDERTAISVWPIIENEVILEDSFTFYGIRVLYNDAKRPPWAGVIPVRDVTRTPIFLLDTVYGCKGEHTITSDDELRTLAQKTLTDLREFAIKLRRIQISREDLTQILSEIYPTDKGKKKPNSEKQAEFLVRLHLLNENKKWASTYWGVVLVFFEIFFHKRNIRNSPPGIIGIMNSFRIKKKDLRGWYTQFLKSRNFSE